MVSPTPDFVEVIRTVSSENTTTPTVTVPQLFSFRAQLSPPTERRSDDLSPRETHPRHALRWGMLFSGNPTFSAGTHLRINGVLHEVLSDTKPISRGFRQVGYEVEVMPVVLLYPFSAQVKTQKGEDVAEIFVALWAPADVREDEGEYETREGEAGVESAPYIKRNNSLWIGDERWRITSATALTNPPRMTFTVRRAGG